MKRGAEISGDFENVAGRPLRSVCHSSQTTCQDEDGSLFPRVGRTRTDSLRAYHWNLVHARAMGSIAILVSCVAVCSHFVTPSRPQSVVSATRYGISGSWWDLALLWLGMKMNNIHA